MTAVTDGEDGRATAAGGVDLASPRLMRLLFRVGLPSMVGLSINALYQIVDMIFVGMLGVEAVAAVAAGLPAILVIAAVGEGIGAGTGLVVSQALGAGRRDRAATAVATAFVLVGVAAAGLIALAMLAYGRLPGLLVPDGDAGELARDYVVVLLCGSALILAQIVCDFVAISKGHTAFSLFTLAVSFSVNLILDPIFMFVLGWGVAGAAAATLVAASVALCLYAWYFLRGPSLIRPADPGFRPSRSVLRPVAAIGLPAAAATLLTAASLGLMMQLAGRHGAEAVAALGIALRLLTAGMLPMAGFCLGAQAVIGFGWGAGDRRRTRRAGRMLFALATAFSAGYAACVVVWSGPIVGLFTSDPATAALARAAVVPILAVFAVGSLPMVTTVLLRATGRTGLAAAVSLAPQGYLLLPLLAVLPALYGFDGLIASHVLATAITAVAAAGVAAAVLARDLGPAAARP